MKLVVGKTLWLAGLYWWNTIEIKKEEFKF